METFELIDRMRERPAIWLGKKSITLMNVFLWGYEAAERDYNIKIKSKKQLLPLDWWFMHEFTKIKCHEYESTAGWCNIILNHCGGDEKLAFDKFYEFFDEFKSLKIKSGRKAVLSKCSKSELIYKNPLAVYIAELLGYNAYVTAVETEEKIEIERYIFRSLKKAEEFAERRFGRIEDWQEIKGDNIDFGKPVY